VDDIAATAGRAAMLDADTYTSPESYEASLLAAGAALVAVDHAVATKGRAAAFVRPPGHHAERARAMGFCLFNNAAVAAQYGLAKGMRRVAVVDYDVHHGNGTQWMFYDEPRILYASVHQYPFYPGTGAASEIGRDAGQGFTANVPLEAGSTDADYDLVFRTLFVPVLEAFDPDLLIVSAGYDAHERDPLGGMRLSGAAFASMDAQLCRVADRCCEGRLVAVTEGGYDLSALEACLEGTLSVLSGRVEAPPARDGSTARATRALEGARAALKPYWPGL
jgi:acetoin utilization deacetylase AcuC-like enzyme